MRSEVIDRLKQLGGKIDHIVGKSLEEDILSIRFEAMLYEKPEDMPWAEAEDIEPIYGLGDYIEQNSDLIEADRESFYHTMVKYFFYETEAAHGQMFWTANLFTPFKEGTADYEEWYEDFLDIDIIDLSEVEKVTGVEEQDFVQLLFSYGFPDHYYISLSDPNQSNPTVFGTDHEGYFHEITNEGPLDQFLQRFMTPEDLIQIVAKALNKVK